MKAIILIAAYLICIGGCQTALAQDKALMKRYTMFATRHIPTTHMLSYKGQLRIDLGHQLYYKNRIKPENSAHSEFLATSISACRDYQLALNYTPWNRVTIGTTIGVGYCEWNYTATTENDTNKVAENSHIMIDIFGSYHDKLGEHFAYELKYAFSANKVNLMSWPIPKLFKNNVFREWASVLSGCYNDFIGTELCHGVTGTVSMFNSNCSLQGGLQLNAEIMHFIKREYNEPYLLNDIAQHIRGEQLRLHLTPALLFAWHAPKVFSVQLHIGLPMAVLKGNVYAACPTWGLQLSFRTIKTGRMPAPTSAIE